MSAVLIPLYYRYSMTVETHTSAGNGWYEWYPSDMSYILFGCVAIISLLSSWCLVYAGRSTSHNDGKPSFILSSILFIIVFITVSAWIYQNSTGMRPPIETTSYARDAVDTQRFALESTQYTEYPRNESMLTVLQSTSDTSFILLLCITGLLTLLCVFMTSGCSKWASVGLIPLLIMTWNEYNITNRYSQQIYRSMTCW
jgi:hypothetical protein